MRRLSHTEVLEVEQLREPVEESLSRAHDDRRDDDRQLVDDPGREGLTDDLGSARGARMSAGHLSRQFRLAYGESPYGYLMTRRIEREQAPTASETACASRFGMIVT